MRVLQIRKDFTVTIKRQDRDHDNLTIHLEIPSIKYLHLISNEELIKIVIEIFKSIK